MSEHVSTRINSSRLPAHIGKTVRLVCKALKIQGDSAVVESTDGGEVTIQLPRGSQFSDPYVEVIGTAVDATTIKMLAYQPMGSDLDMNLLNQVIELTHDPKFYNKMFSESV